MDTVVSDHLRDWLIDQRKLAPKSAGDVVSRCRRVERVFGVSLETASSDDFIRLTDRIRAERGIVLRPGSKPYPVSTYVRSLRLFFEFRASQTACEEKSR